MFWPTTSSFLFLVYSAFSCTVPGLYCQLRSSLAVFVLPGYYYSKTGSSLPHVTQLTWGIHPTFHDFSFPHQRQGTLHHSLTLRYPHTTSTNWSQNQNQHVLQVLAVSALWLPVVVVFLVIDSVVVVVMVAFGATGSFSLTMFSLRLAGVAVSNCFCCCSCKSSSGLCGDDDIGGARVAEAVVVKEVADKSCLLFLHKLHNNESHQWLSVPLQSNSPACCLGARRAGREIVHSSWTKLQHFNSKLWIGSSSIPTRKCRWIHTGSCFSKSIVQRDENKSHQHS